MINHKIQWIALIKLLRPNQWVKNSFLIAPLIFTNNFFHLLYLQKIFSAVILFCIASSATYIINDIKDVEFDRKHPIKSKKRPIATGEVSIPQAYVLLIILYSILFIGYFFYPQVMNVIIAYLLLNLAYTFILKYQPIIDIFSIAIGFVLRVYAGSVAIDVSLSPWMMVTTLSLALYLAAIKRREELINNGTKSREVMKIYSLGLIDRYAEMSATSSLLFYSLFVIEERPDMVITIPFVLYGLFRYWFIVEVLDGAESPSNILVSDLQLIFTVIIWVSLCIYILSGKSVF